jgi:hypothetical protein
MRGHSFAALDQLLALRRLIHLIMLGRQVPLGKRTKLAHQAERRPTNAPCLILALTGLGDIN